MLSTSLMSLTSVHMNCNSEYITDVTNKCTHNDNGEYITDVTNKCTHK